MDILHRNRPRRKPRFMERVKTWLTIGAIGFVVFLIAYAAASYEIGLWNECLRDHSWFYCHRVLS